MKNNNNNLLCARDWMCLHPNGALTLEDFKVKGGNSAGEPYRDKTCVYCRRWLDKESKRKKKREPRQPRQKPKPTDWAEFEKSPWDVKLANKILKKSGIS